MIRKVLAVVFLMALIGTLVPVATADADNREVQFTVNGPVEAPGVILGPGTYDLKLMGDGSTVAGIWSGDGSKFYGYFDTVPVDRNHTPRKASVVLEGSGKAAPNRIEEWFYPGDQDGNEFLYPKTHPFQIAHSPSAHPKLNR